MPRAEINEAAAPATMAAEKIRLFIVMNFSSFDREGLRQNLCTQMSFDMFACKPLEGLRSTTAVKAAFQFVGLS